MGTKYKDIMNHVNVDDEMRERILAAVVEAASDDKASVTPMKKSSAAKVIRIAAPIVAAALALIVGYVLISGGNKYESDEYTSDRHNSITEETIAAVIRGETNDEFGAVNGAMAEETVAVEDCDTVEEEEYAEIQIAYYYESYEDYTEELTALINTKMPDADLPEGDYVVRMGLYLYPDGTFEIIVIEDTAQAVLNMTGDLLDECYTSYSISGTYTYSDNGIVFVGNNDNQFEGYYSEEDSDIIRLDMIPDLYHLSVVFTLVG